MTDDAKDFRDDDGTSYGTMNMGRQLAGADPQFSAENRALMEAHQERAMAQQAAWQERERQEKAQNRDDILRAGALQAALSIHNGLHAPTSELVATAKALEAFLRGDTA